MGPGHKRVKDTFLNSCLIFYLYIARIRRTKSQKKIGWEEINGPTLTSYLGLILGFSNRNPTMITLVRKLTP